MDWQRFLTQIKPGIELIGVEFTWVIVIIITTVAIIITGVAIINWKHLQKKLAEQHNPLLQQHHLS